MMRAGKHSLSFYSNLSANDTLRAQQALVLVVIVMRVDLQGKYNPATTSLPCSNFQKLQALASSLLKPASCRDRFNEIFENENTCKNYFLKVLV